MRKTHMLFPFTVLLFLGACASAPVPGSTVPEPEACRELVYLELKAEHPDSLSDRAWERLRQLDAECRADRSREPSRPDRVDADHHLGAWLWMPAMMVVGGMMWLMMGAF